MAEILHLMTSEFEVRMFVKNAKELHLSRIIGVTDFDTSSESGRRQAGWLVFAAFINPSAALQFQKLAEVAEAMQGHDGRHDSNRDVIKRNTWRDDPLSYLEDVEFKIPLQAADTLTLWENDLRQNVIGMEMRQYEVKAGTLRKAHARFCQMLPVLETCMQEAYFHTPRVPEEPTINPFTAFSAAKHICEEVGVVVAELENFVANIQTRAPPLRTLQDAARQANPSSAEGGLRRRKPKAQRSRTDSAFDFRDEDSNRSGDEQTADLSPSDGKPNGSWRALLTTNSHAANLSDKMAILTRLPWKLRNINQPALIALSLLVSGISGVLLGVGLMQTRPADCVPESQSRDDGFYALVAQLLLQLLSLYCTVIPLTRDKAVSVRKPLFGSTLASSAVAAIVAPVVYGLSWRVSMIASFLSGFTALMASVQLAGGVQEFQRGLG